MPRLDADAYALHRETEIYNNWVRLQCAKRGLKHPGDLSSSDFRDRFWSKGDDTEVSGGRRGVSRSISARHSCLPT